MKIKWPLVLRSTHEHLQANCTMFIRDNLRLRREMAVLKIQLEQALKNDMPHDKKTGKFTKKG